VDPQTFYFMFIVTFTVIAFMIGAAVAMMAITANLEPGSGTDSGAEH
jgi:hypothetical protein